MNVKSLRIAFAGTPQFATHHLEALLENDCNIVAVYTQPDRPSGRGKKLTPSPVKVLAQNQNIPVHQPVSLNTTEQQELMVSLQLDLFIVVAYGLLLPQKILATPRHGCINVHASLLPKWRGAAPIERAILNGDRETGVTIMQMNAGLDTGDILLALSCPIHVNDNCAKLTESLISLGQQGLLETLQQICQNKLTPLKQDDSASSYAKKLNKIEALLQWDKPATQLLQQINAFFPRSPAYCYFNNQRIRIIKAQFCSETFSQTPGSIIEVSNNSLLIVCKTSSLRIEKVQLAGKKIVTIADLLNGQKNFFSVSDIFMSAESASDN